MKKIFTILILLFAVNSIKAQGNLQFNQVKNLEITGTTTLNGALQLTTIGSITVPSGKVWKIESVTAFENTIQANYYTYGLGLKVNIGNHIAYDASNNVTIHYPIWLSAGNYLIKSCGNTGPINVVTSISAIEFNIVP
jgi:hypothetical protein